MNDTVLRKFCESPRRGLIVTIATILLGLVVLTPLVDDYFDSRERCAALRDEIGLAREEAELLPQLVQQTERVVEQLASQESRCVSESTLSDYRSHLVEMVRDSGCQIRRLELSPPIERPWKGEDNPLQEGSSNSSVDSETPFLLERRSVQLSVNGRAAGLYDLLEKLQQDKKLAYPERMEILSDGQEGEELTMELELWLFALARHNS